MGKAVRLDKFLADAGAGTRSEVKKMIQKGFVRINGTVVKKPEQKTAPSVDKVEVNGKIMGAAPDFVYYLLYKPAGYVSATEDVRDKTVLELIPCEKRRNLFPVGRLDKDTEGLLLITDDGALAHELLSPKKHVDKTYYALVDGQVTEEDVKKVAVGVEIGEEKPTLPAKLEILSVKEINTDGRTSWQSEIHLTIHEGKFHQVKRMMEALGKKVTYLKRLSMGALVLPEDMKKGECRLLTKEEVSVLKKTDKNLVK